YFRKSKNGFEQKLVDAVFNQDSIENHDPMALQDFSISTDNFSLIFCAEGHDSENLKCYTYPSGAHVSIFDAVSKEVLSENLSTNILTGITRISHNQKFVVFTIGYNTTTIIDIEKKKLFKFENNEGYHRKFSPSDDLLLIDSDIIDLKNMNIVKSIITGSHVAIANKEFPIIAFMQARMLYVLNYETEEILFRDSFEGKFNGGCKLIQISGDGKYVSVIFRNEYRKYMIGGRSE
ncbi:MAG: hypothetical protein U9N34_04160, partial [Candidatus Cloacimonadota bacterium]|nr:hypothetical protein [Candidatus Cloacimonadota bacterium]